MLGNLLRVLLYLAIFYFVFNLIKVLYYMNRSSKEYKKKVKEAKTKTKTKTENPSNDKKVIELDKDQYKVE